MKSLEELAEHTKKANPILTLLEKDGVIGTFWHGGDTKLDAIIVASLCTNIIENFLDMVPESRQNETEDVIYKAINKLKDYKHLDTSDSPI
jgi:hypothetical protein